MDENEMISFDIISKVGTAKSKYIEAIQLAREFNFDEARKKIKEGTEIYYTGHHSHLGAIQKEAKGNKIVMSLLLTHAEDQLMSTEVICLLSEEILCIYEQISNIKNGK